MIPQETKYGTLTWTGHPASPKNPRRKFHGLYKILRNSFSIIGVTYLAHFTLLSCWNQFTFFKISPNTWEPDPTADTDYPLRPALEPWDISSSYPYPRKLTKEVNEGTWLRIATHPRQQEIVFDMLGDLYCMDIDSATLLDSNAPIRAFPFLQGIPFDKEAAFSPDGTKLVFISDAGFGVDNLWTIPYSSCAQMAALSSESVRASAIQQTNSTFRFFSAPSFHPTEPKMLATKWFLTGRPNGAGEIWEFPLLETRTTTPLPERGGKRLVKRKLPASWPESKYFQSQLGAEQARYVGNGSAIVYTRNIRDDATGLFSYNKDVHKGINAIFTMDKKLGVETMIQDAFPGGANMPRLSHDGKTLAFVRRVKEKSVLVLKDMQSGTVHYTWNELTYDVSPIPAFMGAYPSYGFEANDASIVIWSSGQIWKVPLKQNELGERVLASAPRRIPFVAKIDVALAETRYSETNISKIELQETGRVRSLRGLRSDHTGERVAFEAAGDTYVLSTLTGQLQPIPKKIPEAQYYSPAFIHGTTDVLHARWSNTNLTIFEIVQLPDGNQVNIEGMPRGRFLSPTINHGKIAFVRTGKDYMLGDVEETAGEGVWLGDIEVPLGSGSREPARVSNLRLIDASHKTQDVRIDIRKLDGEIYILIQGQSDVIQYRPSDNLKEAVVVGKTSVEISVSQPMGHPETLARLTEKLFSSKKSSHWVAFRDFQHAWLGSLPPTSYPLKHNREIWSKPSDPGSPKNLIRLSRHGGHDIVFSGDGSRVFWLFGPHLQYASVDEITEACATKSLHVRDSGACAEPLVHSIEINVTYSTDLAMLKKHSRGRSLVLTNATVYAMEDDAPIMSPTSTLIIDGGQIAAVGPDSEIAIPANSKIIDVQGGAVLPGFVDVHGHWGGFLSQYPSTSWELETFLGYGVTTAHNPSSKNVAGFIERHLVEKGALYGPRIYHTGDVLYGSTQPNVYTEINSMKDARDALLRVRVEGGESSFSVKNYQLAARSSRQRLLVQASELGMLIVPEGGWSLDWGLTYFIDGMTSHEHPLPIPTLYDDVISLIAASGSSYTQVAVMNYGGLFGQNWIHQHNNIPENSKLRKYVKHDILTELIEVNQAPDHSYQVFNASISVRKLRERGVRTNIGAHGEQPIGFLYHSEMKFHGMGGQTTYEVLRSATIGGAQSLGLNGSVGSIKVGKMADLVVYPTNLNNINKLWENSMEMRYVIRGGRVFEVTDGLIEVWPRDERRQERGRWNGEYE